MGRYRNYRLEQMAKEALCMHQIWEERYLVLMMTCVDENKRIEMCIDKAERCSTYWLEKYNRLTSLLDN